MWDLSGTQILFETESRFRDAGATTGVNEFPGATLSLASTVSASYGFLRTSAIGLEFLGSYDTLATSGTLWSNSQMMLPYPITYGGLWQDTVVYQPLDGGQSGQEVFNCSADGYGTLVLPAGTVEDVLRTSLISDTSWFSGGVTYWDSTVYHNYWHPAFPFYLARVIISKQQAGSGPVQTLKSTQVLSNLSVGNLDPFDEATGSVLAPNPADQVCGLTLRGDGRRSVVIYDQRGRQVVTREGVIDQNTIMEFDVSDLAAGIYSVHVSDPSVRRSEVLMLAVQ